MIPEEGHFDTNMLFSGGAGMFIEYHDVVKPVYLYAILKMKLTRDSYGLPINILDYLSPLALVEWYTRRRYINPLKCLDYNKKLKDDELDKLMIEILKDESIYKIAPMLNIEKMLGVYYSQHMNFPIYIYSKYEEPYIKKDCENCFSGVEVKYVFGDLKNAMKKCGQNFTYIFSDIESMNIGAEILNGTCSHLLLTREWRYNYIDNNKTLKYNLKDMYQEHPFIRTGTTLAMDPLDLSSKILNLIKEEEIS